MHADLFSSGLSLQLVLLAGLRAVASRTPRLFICERSCLFMESTETLRLIKNSSIGGWQDGCAGYHSVEDLRDPAPVSG